MGRDKDLAVSQEGRRRVDRIDERTLHMVALVGCFAGIILGGEIFHHKTSKTSFWPPVIAATLIWATLLYALANPNTI